MSETDSDEAATESPDVDTDEVTLKSLPEGEWYTLDRAGMDSIKSRNNHLFPDSGDSNGGYSALCGNKNSPKHLKGKHLEPIDALGILFSTDDYCASCLRDANVDAYLPDVREVKEALRTHESIAVEADVNIQFSLPVNTAETLEFLREVAYVTDAVRSDSIAALEDNAVDVEVTDPADDEE